MCEITIISGLKGLFKKLLSGGDKTNSPSVEDSSHVEATNSPSVINKDSDIDTQTINLSQNIDNSKKIQN